jgi:N6-L-threonylcarbamoyladenine synthase
MINRPGLDFSFSGLKTHVANIIRSVGKLSDERKASIAWAFQEAVAKTLAIKCRRAVQQTGLRELVVCGGVAANQRLRSVLHHCLAPEQTRVIYPSPRWCTDNAAMIAYVGHQRLQRGERSAQLNIRPRWPLHEL